MKMSAHKKFINELRFPMKRYEKIIHEIKRRKTEAQCAPALKEENDLRRKLESKFADLFGTIDEDD